MPPSNKTTPQVFTLGYEQRNLEEFTDLLLQERVDVLLDVRETAWSHKPGFSKAALSAAMERRGIEYHHARWAGNPKWIRSLAESQEDCLGMYRQYIEALHGFTAAFVEFIADMLQEGRRVCLVCYERHPADCHRGILAELLETSGQISVVHLAPGDGPRLVLASDKP